MPLFVENGAEIVVHFCILRIQLKSTFKVLPCSVVYSLVREQHTEKDMCGQHIRCDGKCLFVVCLGFTKATHFLELPTDLIMGHGRSGESGHDIIVDLQPRDDTASRFNGV